MWFQGGMNNLGELRTCELPSCTAKTIASSVYASTNNFGLTRFVIDTQNIYFSVSQSVTGAIMKCAFPDCTGGPRAIAQNQKTPSLMAQNSKRLFWIDETERLGSKTLMWVAK